MLKHKKIFNFLSKSDVERDTFRENERAAKKVRIEKDAIPGALKKLSLEHNRG
jgi:hypothetical protein